MSFDSLKASGQGEAPVVHIGLIRGHDPVQPHPCIARGVTPNEESPPRVLFDRIGTDPARVESVGYFTLRYWPETNQAGTVLRVICYACGAMCLPGWVFKASSDTDARGKAVPRKYVILPAGLEGGVIRDRKREKAARACTCMVADVYRTWTRYDRANGRRVLEAVEADARDGLEGAAIVQEGGAVKAYEAAKAEVIEHARMPE